MIQPLDNQALARLVQKAFPQSLLRRAWPLSGGISATMIAVEIQKSDGLKKLIVRSHKQPGLAEKEFRLLQILQAAGLKTPTAYLFDQSGTAASLVIDFLEGEMTFTPTDRVGHVQQLASQLAHLHSLDLSHYDVSFLPQNRGDCVALGRERPFPNPNFPQETAIRTALAKAGTPSLQNRTTLLHGDFWPGNSLWRDGQLTAVIDWEDAHLGDPLIDLAQSRSEIAWIFGPEALDSFTQHYQQQMPLNYSSLPYWDLCAALRQIRLVGDDLPGFADYFAEYGRADITPTTICQNLNQFIEKAVTRLHH